MNEEQIKYMVRRFLGWRLPEAFRPDCGILFEPEYNVEYNLVQGKPPQRHQPIGTNLFAADQTEAMVRYMVDGMPDGGIMSTEVIYQVMAEVDKATTKFPTWPTDPLHPLAVLGEEFGELTKAMLQFTYEKRKGVTREDICEEAIQTAAMAMRLAMSLSIYDYAPAPQHRQRRSSHSETGQ